MFKSYNLFLESRNNSLVNSSVIKSEILSNTGWVEDKIKQEEFDNCEWYLTYMMEGVKIHVRSFKNNIYGDSITYSMGDDNGDGGRFTNNYITNYTQLFSSYESMYAKLTDYERMMKICKYLLNYFLEEPNEETIDFIRECFLDISDICGDLEYRWGYTDIESTDFSFPAFKFSNKLKLGLVSSYYPNGDKWEQIKSEFESNKEKLFIKFNGTKNSLNYNVNILDSPVRIIIDNNFIR